MPISFANIPEIEISSRDRRYVRSGAGRDTAFAVAAPWGLLHTTSYRPSAPRRGQSCCTPTGSKATILLLLLNVRRAGKGPIEGAETEESVHAVDGALNHPLIKGRESSSSSVLVLLLGDGEAPVRFGDRHTNKRQRRCSTKTKKQQRPLLASSILSPLAQRQRRLKAFLRCRSAPRNTQADKFNRLLLELKNTRICCCMHACMQQPRAWSLLPRHCRWNAA